MKILHVDPEGAFGGGERQVLGLLRHLSRRGHENLLAAPPDGALARRVPAADARLLPLAVRNDVDVVAGFRLRRLIRNEAPDVVHFHTARAHAISLFLPAVSPRALVTRRMDYPIQPGWRTHLLYHRRVAAVAAISEEVRRRLVAGGVEPERIHLIPSGVEAPEGLPGAAGRSAARARFGAGGETVLAVVAALEHRKGHDVLLRALAALPERGAGFLCLIAGDGSERAALETQAHALGVGGRVRFLGEQDQVADLLAAADVFVLPSRHEGLGVAILEAMAMGLPVVASAVGGIPESVVPGETGLLVPPGEPKALADALVMLASSGDRGREMGRRGRARVVERFSLARSAELYAALYSRIVARCATARDRG